MSDTTREEVVEVLSKQLVDSHASAAAYCDGYVEAVAENAFKILGVLMQPGQNNWVSNISLVSAIKMYIEAQLPSLHKLTNDPEACQKHNFGAVSESEVFYGMLNALAQQVLQMHEAVGIVSVAESDAKPGFIGEDDEKKDMQAPFGSTDDAGV